MKPIYEKYFRKNLPHIWCAGCGNGIVMSSWARAMEQLGLENDQLVGVSGIGCSSRTTSYLDINTMHTAHGRALPFATGAKLARPELNVFIFSGDGDCLAIGGNHFLHACHRDLDMVLIVFNNHIYGMTGGQFSPATPENKISATSPYGTINESIDMCAVAKAAGASFVARGDIYHAKQLTDLIVEATKHKGMSVIEVMATCPVSYGKNNKMSDPLVMMNYIKDNSVSAVKAAKMKAEELKDKIVYGILHQIESSEYYDRYKKKVEEIQGGAE